MAPGTYLYHFALSYALANFHIRIALERFLKHELHFNFSLLIPED